MINRKLNWVSSINSSNRLQIENLENKLSAFYTGNPDYYGDIDFTADNWVSPYEEGYKQIVSHVLKSKKTCEFGCGNANLLKHFPQLQDKYSGCDFSERLIADNRKKYPAAFFELITVPNLLPYADEKFDLVFSVFVLEHSTNPSKLLDESARILQPGGRLFILCPDFLGQGRMTSQRSGWSEGTSKEKLKRGKYIDALVTLFDNRIKIPFYCKSQLGKNKIHPQFLVNVFPTVFEDKFYPDVDAVYVTCADEIILYLQDKFTLENNSMAIQNYAEEKKLILLSFIKK